MITTVPPAISSVVPAPSGLVPIAWRVAPSTRNFVSAASIAPVPLKTSDPPLPAPWVIVIWRSGGLAPAPSLKLAVVTVVLSVKFTVATPAPVVCMVVRFTSPVPPKFQVSPGSSVRTPPTSELLTVIPAETPTGELTVAAVTVVPLTSNVPPALISRSFMVTGPPETVTSKPAPTVTSRMVVKGVFIMMDEPAPVTSISRVERVTGEPLLEVTPPPASCSGLGEPPRGVAPLNSISPPAAMKVVWSASVAPRFSNCSVPSPACVSVVATPDRLKGIANCCPAPVEIVPVHAPPPLRVIPPVAVSGAPPRVTLARSAMSSDPVRAIGSSEMKPMPVSNV